MTAEQLAAFARLRERIALLDPGRGTLVVSRDDVEALVALVEDARQGRLFAPVPVEVTP